MIILLRFAPTHLIAGLSRQVSIESTAIIFSVVEVSVHAKLRAFIFIFLNTCLVRIPCLRLAAAIVTILIVAAGIPVNATYWLVLAVHEVLALSSILAGAFLVVRQRWLLLSCAWCSARPHNWYIVFVVIFLASLVDLNLFTAAISVVVRITTILIEVSHSSSLVSGQRLLLFLQTEFVSLHSFRSLVGLRLHRRGVSLRFKVFLAKILGLGCETDHSVVLRLVLAHRWLVKHFYVVCWLSLLSISTLI